MRLCTQRWNCESETLRRGWGRPPSFTFVSCVAPVEGVTFQHCVYLTIIPGYERNGDLGWVLQSVDPV